MRIRKIQTRFMEANKDIDSIIYDVLQLHYGIATLTHETAYDIDWCEALYSNGFVMAIKEGRIPKIHDIIESYKHPINKNQEFHHIIYNDECYAVYFDDPDEE